MNKKEKNIFHRRQHSKMYREEKSHRGKVLVENQSLEVTL